MGSSHTSLLVYIFKSCADTSCVLSVLTNVLSTHACCCPACLLPAAGRSGQARTAEWGRGPNSSMLFVILYRMRLLLLYGVWVTVLYGAFRAVVDLTTAAGKAGYHMINRAANMLYGPEDGFEGDGSSSGSPGESTPDAAASQRVAAAAAQCSEEAAADGSNHTGAGAGSRASSSSFPAKNRPTATVFEDMMSAVIPVYLMLLGSVVFFASI